MKANELALRSLLKHVITSVFKVDYEAVEDIFITKIVMLKLDDFYRRSVGISDELFFSFKCQKNDFFEIGD